MMKAAALVVLLLLIGVGCTAGTPTIPEDVNGDYNVSITADSVMMGESVAVSWAGNCSVEYPTGCYDWISVFPKGACDSGFGQNTCYMTGQWAWCDNLPVPSNAAHTAERNDYQSGTWKYNFVAPGQYEFRISRCWCAKCEPLMDDVISCGRYPTISRSVVVTVQPLFNITAMTKEEQVILGMLWYYLDSRGVPNAEAVIESLINQTYGTPDGVGRRRRDQCDSCLCDLSNFAEDFSRATLAFYQLYNQPSISTVQKCFSNVASVLGDMVPTFGACGLDALTGQNIEAGMAGVALDLAAAVSGIGEVLALAIEGRNIYIDTVNFFSSYQAEQFFAVGVYFGAFVDVVKSLIIPGVYDEHFRTL